MQCENTEDNETKKRQFSNRKAKQTQFRRQDDPKDQEETTGSFFFMQEKSY